MSCGKKKTFKYIWGSQVYTISKDRINMKEYQKIVLHNAGIPRINTHCVYDVSCIGHIHVHMQQTIIGIELPLLLIFSFPQENKNTLIYMGHSHSNVFVFFLFG